MLKFQTQKKALPVPFESNNVFISNIDGNNLSYTSFNALVKKKIEQLKVITNGSSNQPIGLLSSKNTESISFVFSIIQSNHFYLPIVSFLPTKRIIQIIKLSSLNYLIIENVLLKNLKTHFYSEKMKYAVEELNSEYSMLLIDQKPKLYPKNSIYCLFTSGSTGFPKGIIHSKNSLNAFISWCKKEFNKYEIKNIVSITPLHFDLSVFDLFYTYQTNKTLCLTTERDIFHPKSFLKEINLLTVDCLYATPTFFDLLLTFGSISTFDLSKVKLLLIAGEPLKTKLCHDLLVHFKNATIYNLYGPTETNVCSFYKFNPKLDYGMDVPIGKSCYKDELMISNTKELQYKGKTLMSSYIDQKGKLVVLKPNDVYKTGDFITKENAQIIFKKRKDKLIKKNGFRINLMEINRILLAHPYIIKSHVFMDKQNSLVAIVHSSKKNLNEIDFKRILQ